MNIPIETLTAIKNELPNGAQADIAKECDYSPEYVSMVLNGKVDVNDSNKTIVIEAQRIIRKNREENEKLMNDLNETINPTA